MLKQQALALGRENLQYKARLSKQHKVMVMQMHMISHLETVLQKKVCTLSRTVMEKLPSAHLTQQVE